MTFSNPSEFDASLPSSSGDKSVSDASGEYSDETRAELEQSVAVAGGQAEGEDLDEAPKPPLEYEYAIEEVEACKRRVLVTIPQREVQRFFADELMEIKDTAAVPGFRPGHVPRKLLEKRYWVELKESLKAKLMLAAFEDLSEKKAFAPISDPDLDLAKVELPDDGDFVFEFSIEVRPQFTIENWKGLKLQRPVFQVSDAFRDQKARQFLESQAELAEVDGPAEMGDYIVADLTLRLDDRVINSAEDETIRIRPTLSFFDGIAENFGEAMVGVRAGETRTCAVTVSQECRDPELVGKTVEAVFKVRAVKRHDLAGLAQRLGTTEAKLAEEMREELDRTLAVRLESKRAESLRKQVLDQLIGQLSFELPRDLVKKQTIRELRRMALDMQSQGYSEEDIQRRLNLLQRQAGERWIGCCESTSSWSSWRSRKASTFPRKTWNARWFASRSRRTKARGGCAPGSSRRTPGTCCKTRSRSARSSSASWSSRRSKIRPSTSTKKRTKKSWSSPCPAAWRGPSPTRPRTRRRTGTISGLRDRFRLAKIFEDGEEPRGSTRFFFWGYA